MTRRPDSLSSEPRAFHPTPRARTLPQSPPAVLPFDPHLRFDAVSNGGRLLGEWSIQFRPDGVRILIDWLRGQWPRGGFKLVVSADTTSLGGSHRSTYEPTDRPGLYRRSDASPARTEPAVFTVHDVDGSEILSRLTVGHDTLVWSAGAVPAPAIWSSATLRFRPARVRREVPTRIEHACDAHMPALPMRGSGVQSRFSRHLSGM